ncbi:hypothetical protein [Brachyspira aalborgi]|uniref:hypothetical protein n=1 Tax=Brachyspira aalborgi TaxID=29522 RepID=UPI0011C7C82F|nr:hypothetical protein [Brachyspira aalborgi]TXJ47967.1 hypothetical protein EPJ75_09420 [Brachyspira aalborgi]
MYSNVFSSEIRQQNRTEQNRTEQNRTEPLQGFLAEGTQSGSQNRTGFLVKIEQSVLQNGTITKLISIMERNYYKAYFIAKQNLAKFISVV